jgi:nucleoid DNA-binding protein
MAAKPKAVKEAYTRTQMIQHIADDTGLPKKEVKAVFESLKELIAAHLNKKGPREMSFMSLFKLMSIKKPATKARKGINPFTGEETVFKAKPAKNVVKVRPLKKLKEMAE